MSASVVRLRLALAYDGSGFSGWASQPGLRTAQGTLESTLARVLRIDAVAITVAGRTDAGVHARGQVCHVDVPASALDQCPPERIRHRLARALPADVRVTEVGIAPAGFDARFSAIWCRYAYRVNDDAAAADPLIRSHVLAWPRSLDHLAMNEAAAGLLGEHDFAAFCKRREGATTIRELTTLQWTRSGSSLTLTVVADAFCHHMVRSLVGCLVRVGEGAYPISWPSTILHAGVRDPRVPVVEPHGLVLEQVGYPPDSQLATRAHESRRMRA